jgi:hypothetical protein
MQITTISLDLAKHVFHVHAVDAECDPLQASNITSVPGSLLKKASIWPRLGSRRKTR